MQKLIWTNSKGDSINLTSGDFGITHWEGFSNTSLSIQSQQVPMVDGSIYLDSLLEPRELSVTLAICDNNNLEKRYRLRRELISVLNPKLGEGYLIYKNNFISKRIKCIPQIPLFPTKNSNDRGTQKGELSWTACDPYWEDLELSSTVLVPGVRTSVVNNGDVPCELNIDFLNDNVTNPEIKNFTENKKIKLSGTFNENINIDTNIGVKSIYEEKFKFTSKNINAFNFSYSEKLNLFMAVNGNDGLIYTSSDGINWECKSAISNRQLFDIIYSEKLNLFVAVGLTGVNHEIVSTVDVSSDGINWELVSDTFLDGFYKVTYSEEKNLFVAVGYNGSIVTSPDGMDWTQQTSGTQELLQNIIYSEEKNLFVAVGYNGSIVTSPDGVEWTVRYSGVSTHLNSVVYSKELNLFVIGGNAGIILTSPDGMSWTQQASGMTVDFNSIAYSENLNLFVAVCSNYKLVTSPDGVNWTENLMEVSNRTYKTIIRCENLGMFFAIGDNVEIISTDGFNWTSVNNGISDETFSVIKSITYSEEKNLFVAVGYNTSEKGFALISSDGFNWQITSKDFVGYKIIYVENKKLFVAVGKNNNEGIIATSPDGINWTQQAIIANNENYIPQDIIYIENLNLFVAIGNESNQSFVITSNDLNTWTLKTDEISGTLNSIAYSKNLNLFILVGVKSLKYLIITSNDLESYTEQTNEFNGTLNSITFSEEKNLFVAVGFNGKFITSSNGVDWLSTNFNYLATQVIYAKSLGLFVVLLRNGSIYYSLTGISWNYKSYISAGNFNSIIYSEKLDLFVAVGRDIITDIVFEKGNNIISKLTGDSDLTFGLKNGENIILCNKESGNFNCRLIYRQKYIGV